MHLGLEPPLIRYLGPVELPKTPPLRTVALGIDVDAGGRSVEEGPSGPNSGPLEGLDINLAEVFADENPREGSTSDCHPSTSQAGGEECIFWMLESSMEEAGTNGIGGDRPRQL